MGLRPSCGQGTCIPNLGLFPTKSRRSPPDSASALNRRGEPMTDRIHSYLEVKKRCDDAFAALSRLRSAILTVGAALQSTPRNFSFANVNVGMPVLIGNSFDAHNWPAAEDIQ